MSLNHLQEYKNNKELVAKLLRHIRAASHREIRLMEVCGTHTVAIFRHGLRELLPSNIRLLSGPGCPVCVTAMENIDEAIAAAELPGVILTTFGDMLKVPGSRSSLAEAKAGGADVRIVYSTMDALALAEHNPDKEVVFFGIGFETTAPTVAAAIITAAARGTANFSVLGTHKLIPEAMRAIVQDKSIGVNGFICPGHVSTIIGVTPYQFLAQEYGIPSVITGFEAVDILQAILMLIHQIEGGQAMVEIQYSRGVTPDGNPTARNLLAQVFQVEGSTWRGMGFIPGTGLALRQEYAAFDARKKLNLRIEAVIENSACKCGDILRGLKVPHECSLFAKVCTPEHPLGACMVSAEGTCAAYYKYGNRG
ncbi:MAG TPA: hydrogenase formation protein HypD [Bacillota bacterium]|nr:hydrogenase formation protein HypD [Bacillota bacterium]